WRQCRQRAPNRKLTHGWLLRARRQCGHALPSPLPHQAPMSSSVHSKAAPEPPAAPRTLEQAEARIRELTEQVAELEARVRELERTQAPVRGAAVANDDAALLREREAMFAEVERLARVGSWLWDVR